MNLKIPAGKMNLKIPAGKTNFIQGMLPVLTSQRSKEANQEYFWNWLVSPYHKHAVKDLKLRPYAIDNGAYTCFNQKKPFDSKIYLRYLDLWGSECLWTVIPDKVGNREETLIQADLWIPRIEGHNLLICLQDGMIYDDIIPFLGRIYGVFLGGSTEYKLSKACYWGHFAQKHDLYYHIGRVNTVKRIRLCIQSGADSFDGTGMIRFPTEGERISRWMKKHSIIHQNQLGLFNDLG